MLMWELLNEAEPFEGDIASAVQYVVKEDARPQILTVDSNESMLESRDVGARESGILG